MAMQGRWMVVVVVVRLASNGGARIGQRARAEKCSHDVNDCGRSETLASRSRLVSLTHHNTMAAARLVLRSSRTALSYARPFSASAFRFKDLNERGNDTVEEHRKRQTEKPLNPHMTNTTSTIANELPSIGKDGPPPEMLSSVDPKFVPKDSVPEKTQHMTGGTQKGAPEAGVNSELQVGELEGAKFRIEPIQRVGEDANTMRARLICLSRVRLYPVLQ